MNKKNAGGVSFDDLLEQVRTIVSAEGTGDERLLEVCKLLNASVPHYNWVGFYKVDPANPQQLAIGPYAGARTDHVRIDFGKGVCGQVAVDQHTKVVQDVSAESNYLSCSIDVKAEIVVPVFVDGSFTAELDIDSNETSPFTDEDMSFCEWVAALVSPLFRD